jgi:regulator of cell morphogenesis and NO signaling
VEATDVNTRDAKLGQIVSANPGAERVLEEAGLDYCCGGQRSLDDACAQAGLSEEELLERLRENELAGAADMNWASTSLAELTRHIREKHHRYVRDAIQRVQPLAAKVKAKHGAHHPELSEIERLFLQLAHEMTMHMQKEEMILFPYIGALERAANGDEAVERPFFDTVGNPIQAMMKEHDCAGDLAKQIRKITSGYATPSDSCASFTSLYDQLREFEADLHQHIHLENDILFPCAVKLEAHES